MRGGVCIHRGSCSDDSDREVVVDALRLRIVVGALATVRMVFDGFEVCDERRHLKHTNGDVVGAIVV